MARPLRIEFDGALYHITARGNERCNIFREEEDFGKFVQILEKYVERFAVRIHCFVLMNNHYHLVAETPCGNLSAFMHNVQSHYTGYFNRRHSRVGHLFQGRYKALIVDKESYLIELSRYVHLNPVRAGLVDYPQKWRWSSFRDFSAAHESVSESWLETGETLKYFGKQRKKAVRKYVEYVMEGMRQETSNPLDDVEAQLILGPEEFVKKIRVLIEDAGKELDSEIISGLQLARWTREEADESIMKIAEACSAVKKDILKTGGRKNRARQAAVMVFHMRSRWTVSEIGEQFGISGSAVNKIIDRLNEEMEKNQRLHKEMTRILSIVSA